MKLLETLENNEVIKNALGEHIYSKFKQAKEKEYDRFRITVTEWEREEYIKQY